jgi:hypothetical protein
MFFLFFLLKFIFNLFRNKHNYFILKYFIAALDLVRP